MAELGTVTDDTSTYVRKNTNVAILATRRGISLKCAVRRHRWRDELQPGALELQGGLRCDGPPHAEDHLRGPGTDSGGTAANELGLYDANAFTGLRSILNTANAVNIDPATTPDDHRQLPRRASTRRSCRSSQAGGRPSSCGAHPSEKITFNEQQDPNVRHRRARELRQHRRRCHGRDRSTPSLAAPVGGRPRRLDRLVHLRGLDRQRRGVGQHGPRPLHPRRGDHHAAVPRIAGSDGPRDPDRHLGPAHPPVHHLPDERAGGEGAAVEQQDPGQGLDAKRAAGAGCDDPAPACAPEAVGWPTSRRSGSGRWASASTSSELDDTRAGVTRRAGHGHGQQLLHRPAHPPEARLPGWRDHGRGALVALPGDRFDIGQRRATTRSTGRSSSIEQFRIYVTNIQYVQVGARPVR